jgi:Spy/CpxP family protein refolding chaperone
MNSIIARLTVLTVIAAAFVLAQPDGMKGMHKELKLTDAQQEQFEKISFDTRKKQIELKAKLETSQLELQRLLSAESLDKSAVEKKLNELASSQVAMRMNHINGWSEKNKVLNADQQKLWKKMLRHHPGAMKGRGEGRMMRGRSMKGGMPGHMMQRTETDGDMPMHMERRIEKKIIKE